jgi:hypothetical protein
VLRLHIFPHGVSRRGNRRPFTSYHSCLITGSYEPNRRGTHTANLSFLCRYPTKPFCFLHAFLIPTLLSLATPRTENRIQNRFPQGFLSTTFQLINLDQTRKDDACSPVNLAHGSLIKEPFQLGLCSRHPSPSLSVPAYRVSCPSFLSRSGTMSYSGTVVSPHSFIQAFDLCLAGLDGV